MDIGKVVRVIEVRPEPYPYQHPENVPEEPHPAPSAQETVPAS